MFEARTDEFGPFCASFVEVKRVLDEVERVLEEVCAGDGDGSDGGGLGAEDTGTEGDGSPGVIEEDLHLFGGPAAFGADGEGDAWRLGRSKCGGLFTARRVGREDGVGCDGAVGHGLLDGGLEGGGLIEFAKEDAGGGGLGGEDGFEGGGVSDLRDGGSARLFRGFKGDATPAFGSFAGGLREVFFGAAGEDGGDAVDAELGGFFDGPLKVVELEDGEQEMEGKGGVGFELFMEGEGDAVGSDGGDLGAVKEAAGDEVEGLAGLGTEDAGEVGGLVAGEVGGVAVTVPGVGDEAAAGHGDSLGGVGEVGLMASAGHELWFESVVVRANFGGSSLRSE